MSRPSDFSYNDAVKYMEAALAEARLAAGALEVPVGAAIVSGDGRILAKGRNDTVSTGHIHGHAEINAINRLIAENGRVPEGASLFVTLRPCTMCMGAIISSGIRRIYYAAGRDPSAGDYFPLTLLPVGTEAFGGILEDEARELLENFFRELRTQDT